MRDRLNERELRNGKRCRDACHFNPDQPVASAQHRLIFQTVSNAQSWSKIKLVQAARGFAEAVLAQVIQFLSLQIEDRTMVGRVGRRKIARVAQARVNREARRSLKIILHKIFLSVRARAQDTLLNVNGEGLHLTEQKASERVSSEGRKSRTDGWNCLRVREQCAESKISGRRRWLNHIEPCPAPVDPELERMPPTLV